MKTIKKILLYTISVVLIMVSVSNKAAAKKRIYFAGEYQKGNYVLSLSQFSFTEPGSDEKGCFELSKNNTLLFSDVLHSFGKSKNEYLVDTRSYSFLFKVKKKKVIVKYIDGTNIDGISGEKKKYYGTYKLNYRYYS
jgi:hypothetical protein